MMPGQMGRLNNMRGNGMIPANLQKTALQNNTGGLYELPPTPFPSIFRNIYHSQPYQLGNRMLIHSIVRSSSSRNFKRTSRCR